MKMYYLFLKTKYLKEEKLKRKLKFGVTLIKSIMKILKLKNAKSPKTTVAGIVTAVISILVIMGLFTDDKGQILVDNLEATITFFTTLITSIILVFGAKDGDKETDENP